ncbi:MAG: histidine--tRNA ligase [Devosia sp.]
MAGKSKLIDARLPRGFEDRGAAEIAAMDAMIATIKRVYERYGFDPVETPLFEYTEALGKFLPDTDRPNAGVFSLQDDDERWMSLRYDLTAPLARHFAENFERLPKPYRSYRAGYVFRNEKPGPGRFRQFMQFDADTVGAPGPEADAEMCMMMADTMDALGLQGKYVVKVNNRKLLDGVLDQSGLSAGNPASVNPMLLDRRLQAMRALDKFDRLGRPGVELLLGPGRVDESGDFTPGLDLHQQFIDGLVWLLELRGQAQAAGASDAFNPLLTMYRPAESTPVARDLLTALRESAFGENATVESAIEEFRSMEKAIVGAGYSDGRIRIDPSVVRGLEYYTGPVFEIELTFPVTNEKGEQVVFGSVGGGGRYDGLVSRFRSEPVPATGFSIGVSRLAHALKLTGNLGGSEPVGPVVVLVMDKDRVADYQKMTSELRNAGIRAEMFLGATKNFGKQVAYADKRQSPAVIIQGQSEREAEGGEIVQIKDMAAGAEAAKSISDNAAWKAERPGQFAVPRADLVSAVKALLAGKTPSDSPN